MWAVEGVSKEPRLQWEQPHHPIDGDRKMESKIEHLLGERYQIYPNFIRETIKWKSYFGSLTSLILLSRATLSLAIILNASFLNRESASFCSFGDNRTGAPFSPGRFGSRLFLCLS